MNVFGEYVYDSVPIENRCMTLPEPSMHPGDTGSEARIHDPPSAVAPDIRVGFVLSSAFTEQRLHAFCQGDWYRYDASVRWSTNTASPWPDLLLFAGVLPLSPGRRTRLGGEAFAPALLAHPHRVVVGAARPGSRSCSSGWIEELLEGTWPSLPDMADPYTGKRVRQAELFE